MGYKNPEASWTFVVPEMKGSWLKRWQMSPSPVVLIRNGGERRLGAGSDLFQCFIFTHQHPGGRRLCPVLVGVYVCVCGGACASAPVRVRI